jgi:inner membrane protein
VKNGIHAAIKPDITKNNTFEMNITLNGSESLFFIPAGKSTYVHLTSDWNTPSFDGSLITDDNTVNDEGFSAEWNVLDLTRSYPQKWTGSDFQQKIKESAFGVNLLIPVDIYQKATRSVKYALLFICLTFLVLFFIEIKSNKRIHPVQYLLTGAALVVFYSLLIALSEHTGFAIAYTISAIATVGLITAYVQMIFQDIRNSIITLIILATLHGFLYAILHLADMALLIGNIGLFIILALVMFFSRKIDWYSNRNQEIE